MESDFIKTITPNTIIQVFDRTDIVNIRHYEPINKHIVDVNNFDVPIKYKVRIRHNENDNPKKNINILFTFRR